jgi:hypothetical protein
MVSVMLESIDESHYSYRNQNKIHSLNVHEGSSFFLSHCALTLSKNPFSFNTGFEWIIVSIEEHDLLP